MFSGFWSQFFIIALGITLGLVLALFLMRKTLAPHIARLMGDAYQQRFMKKLKKQYPLLAERIDGFDMTPATQDGFKNAMMRLPPQEAMKLQTEFNRLRENFMGRHPELNPLIAGATDARGQMKAMDRVMKLPADQRAAIEKDLLWAWDQLRGRFPKLMGPLEAALRKKPTTTVG